MSEYILTKNKQFQEKVLEAPLNPGCYLYKNDKGKILYIGKAKVLRKRVKSYFLNYKRIDPKYQIMLDQATTVDYVIADSEIEALILEANLIKKYKPKYNKMLVDDKNYIWIRIDRRKGSPIPQKVKESDELVPGSTYPTINVIRSKIDDGAHYFGPYPDTRPVRRSIDNIRKIFPFCTNGKKYHRSKGNLIKVTKGNKPCFHYHIGLCDGVCAGLESPTSYNKKIENVKKFFKGEKGKIEQKLNKEMQDAARNHNYEKAAKLRDKLKDIKYATKYIALDQDMDEVEIMAKKAQQKKDALEDLIAYLDFPNLVNKKRFRIECYDISNIQGTNATGAMTVFIDGKAEPSMYRKFKIRMKNEPNDFAMMQETLFRRFYSYLVHHQIASKLVLKDSSGYEINPSKYFTVSAKKFDESLNTVPDIIVIDGGKGQLSSAYKIMRSFNLNIPIIGLAKREEEVFVVEQQRIDEDFLSDSGLSMNEIEFKKIHLPRSSEASYILQRIRDEAHRFGITYHRKLRLKQTFETKYDK